MPKPYPKDKRQRRVMTKLSISEVSLVGSPAQEGALAVIMKRRDDDPGKQGTPANKQDVNKGKVTTQVHYQTESRETRVTETEGMDDKEARYAMGKQTGTQKNDGAAGTGEGTGQPDSTEKRLEAMEKEVEALKARNQQLEKDAERAEKEAALSESERAHYDALDETTKTAFLEMDGTARTGEIQKAADANAVVYTSTVDGTVYRKNDDPKTIALAKQNDALQEKFNKMEEDKAQQDLEVRAEKELPHLPGTAKERAALLKAVEAIPDNEARKKALEALKANNDSMAKAFKTIGHTAPSDTDDDDIPINQINKKVDELAKSENIPRHQAYMKFIESPEGQALYSKTIQKDRSLEGLEEEIVAAATAA